MNSQAIDRRYSPLPFVGAAVILGISLAVVLASKALPQVMPRLLQASPPRLSAPAVAITIDANTRHQTLRGFGQAEPSSLNYPGQTLNDQLRAVAIDKAFRQVGLNMGIIGTLLESPGTYDQRQNDNGDPFNFNWAGFNADTVNTAKQYVADPARPYGFTGYFLGAEAPNVRWGSPWLAPLRTANYGAFLDEAAEQVVANLSWWKSTYGEDLPFYQLGNEQMTGNMASINPDLSGFGPVDPVQQMVDLAGRAGGRARAAGSGSRFVVGTEETVAASYKLASAILSDPQARQYVGAIGYHSYPYYQGYSSASFILGTSGVGKPDPTEVALRNQIRDLAGQNGVPVWMMENSHGGLPLSYDDFRARAIQIHDEFLYANASAYFGEASMWDLASQRGHFGNSDLYGQDDEGNVVLINNDTGAVDITGIGYAIGHYARWVDPGAIRVDASASDPLVQATAFRNDETGILTVVLINNSADTAVANVSGTPIHGAFSGEQSTPAAYWTPLTGVSFTSDSGFSLTLPSLSVTSVSVAMTGISSPVLRTAAASFGGTVVAESSLATALLPDLPLTVAIASVLPLPTTLGGATLSLTDSAGTTRPALLSFVSPGQINFEVPPGTASGPASLLLTQVGGLSYSGPVSVTRIAPSLFTATASGTGVAAAQLLRIRADGTQSLDLVFQCQSQPGSCVPLPLDLSGASTDRMFLILYGTGIRNRTSLSGVRVTIGGQDAPVLFAGPHPSSPGLDQVNVSLPVMTGPANKYLVLTVDGQPANVITIGIQ